ncbi:hypothetical protein BC827DRAFT_1214808 [Russula dissimulans]|nr:hypothetical protein BC827DRAFT_1214808 [Russula dissimulans]
MGDQQETQATSPSDSMQTTLITIVDLPLELLQLIFSYCSHSEQPYPACRPGLVQARWMSITHVCRQWRAAALNHPILWTSINTDILGMSWAKVFMERSNPALVDVSLKIDPTFYGTTYPNAHEVVALLTTSCTRLRSLHINGKSKAVSRLLDMLHTATSIRSLSLHIVDRTSLPFELAVDLFGGQAPIREVCLSAMGHIVTPHQLFNGVTHFTSDQYIPLQDLLDSLQQMPALQSFTLGRCRLDWQDSDAPSNVHIPMPNLLHFTVQANARSPVIFAILHRRLTLPEGAKMRVRARKSSDWDDSALWAPYLLTLIDTAKGLRHMRLSGEIEEGSFCLWTGDLDCEEAAFSFDVSWRNGTWGDAPSPIFRLAELCDLLGTEDVLTLAFLINPLRCVKLGREYWWNLLGRLPCVEELELRVDAVRELKIAWRVDSAPAVLPALRSVRMVQVKSSVKSVAEMTEERLINLLQRSARKRIRMQPD